jgi:hypothetical protein
VRVRVPEGERLLDVGGGAFGFDRGRWVVASPGATSLGFETTPDSTAQDSL